MIEFTFKDISSSSMKVKVLNVRRSVLPSIRDQYELISGKTGSYLFPQPFGDKLIEIECVLVSQSSDNVWQDTRPISAWLTSDKKEKLIINKEPDKYYMAKVSNTVDLEQFLYIGQFTIQFTCEPFAYSLEDIVIEITAQPGIPYGIYNNGTAEATPAITLTATYGEVVNPKIMINNITFLYKGTLTAGGQIDINSETFTAYKSMDRDINTTWAYDPAEDSILAMIDGEFPVLQPGQNLLIYNCDNGMPIDIKIQYKERWI